MVAVRVQGLEELIKGSSERAERLANMEPVLAVMAEDMKQFVRDRFESGTDPMGDDWVPLEPATIAGRRKGRKGRKAAGGEKVRILVDTAILQNSINAEATKRRLIVGTNIEYALFHQEGTEAMFARPFIPVKADFATSIGEAEMKSFKRMITAYVLRGELG